MGTPPNRHASAKADIRDVSVSRTIAPGLVRAQSIL
jgi:hypothetical protein